MASDFLRFLGGQGHYIEPSKIWVFWPELFRGIFQNPKVFGLNFFLVVKPDIRDNFTFWDPDMALVRQEKLWQMYSEEAFSAKSINTAVTGRLGLKSARLGHSSLCSIYETKNDSPKNMKVLWRTVVSKLLPLRPKVIKNELNFRKWTIKKFNNFCQN